MEFLFLYLKERRTAIMNDVFYNVNEIMKMLKVERRTILKLINQNKLKAFKIGKEWRIPKAELDKFIELKILEQNKYN